MKLFIAQLMFLYLGFGRTEDILPGNDYSTWPSFLEMVNRYAAYDEGSPLDCRVNYVHDYTFNCGTSLGSEEKATSVHMLRPSDISVIGAMGDSLTAGFGADACTFNGMATEYRGISWPIGGDQTVDEIMTLPNLIKKYNPNLRGAAEGIAGYFDEAAGFNAAISGSRSEHMVLMTTELIKRIKNDPGVNFEEDWKLVTVFIGANDLCQYCINFHKYSVEQYVSNIRDALDLMHTELPNTLVNVIGILNVPEVDTLSSLKCDAIHFIACNCAMFKQGDKRAEIEDLTRSYQVELEKLIMSGRYETSDDFTVVYQPYFVGTHFPLLPNGDPDDSFFAPDCFHFSSKGHAAAAKELWNNMFQPVGQKTRSLVEDLNAFKCPTQEYPYIYTNVNSGLDPEVYPYGGNGQHRLVVEMATIAFAMFAFICNQLS